MHCWQCLIAAYIAHVFQMLVCINLTRLTFRYCIMFNKQEIEMESVSTQQRDLDIIIIRLLDCKPKDGEKRVVEILR